LLASIRDENPVIFLEPKVLLASKANSKSKIIFLQIPSCSVEHVPVDDYTLPLSSAEVLQSGDTITLLSWGAPLYSCVEAMNMLRDPPKSIADQVPKGIRSANVELIDLRTILPWDRESAYLCCRRRCQHPDFLHFPFFLSYCSKCRQNRTLRHRSRSTRYCRSRGRNRCTSATSLLSELRSTYLQNWRF
jgi:hypothetical protein